MAKLLRLDKLLADTGRWSRKEAKDLIRQGRVKINDTVVRQGERKVDPEGERVLVDDAAVNWSEYVYLMLNKPAGYLTATEDRTAPTVMDLIPQEVRRADLAPVGRLDKDTVGLLLITNNGPLAHQLLSPRHHVDKQYLAWVNGNGTEEDCGAFREGIVLEDGTKCLPAKLELLEPGLCKVTIREGKFHQVKRMLASRGMPVRQLKRLTMGPLKLDERLEEGQVRSLSQEEINALLDAGK